WAQTADGSPWIGVSCQTQGADLWWPVKDHPSDRPDSLAISITVPKGLVAASNGKLLGTRERNEKTTFDWFLSTPINPYNVTVNIAPYVTISDTYISTAGDSVETTFWVLPEDEAKGKELFPQFIEQMRFYEEMLGPYAFRDEKYGIVHTPYLGMEHQTIIAYGAGFKDGALFGQHSDYDDLMHHELGHEWWGNLVSVADWKDFWIHEGITTYMQALFTEQRRGMDAYFANMQYFSTMIDNRQPLAPRESRSAGQMYQGRDVYYKGASVLHTLRYLVGDERFFTILRRFAYPDPKMEAITDGSSMRYSSTEEFRNIAEKHGEMSLDWFFEVYMYQPELPELVSMVQGDNLILEWVTPGNLTFNMPVEVVVNDISAKITFIDNKAVVPISVTGDYEIDPNHWVLRKKR
ncbi:MAG TPA: peptidase M1, partial [Bacteroidetes bacterium]|nr:peptidase M1 [Bacteroidota bacterium]